MMNRQTIAITIDQLANVIHTHIECNNNASDNKRELVAALWGIYYKGKRDAKGEYKPSEEYTKHLQVKEYMD